MTEQQERIWNFLQENAVGYPNAIYVSDLAERLGIAPFGTNNDDLRAEIRNMLVNEGLPIGTSRTGVFIITSEDERARAIRWVDRDTTAKVTALRGIELFSAL